MRWRIIDTGVLSAQNNMSLDRYFLDTLDEKSCPILHFYDWLGKAATYGHFMDPYRFLNRVVVERTGLDLAKRPTGGGIIFHLSDFAFSVLIPAGHPLYSENTLLNYANINGLTQRAIAIFLGGEIVCDFLVRERKAQGASGNFCMAKPTIYDLILDGKKVGGAAQRRTKKGLLHQGSISLALAPFAFLEEVLLDGKVLENMRINGGYLISKELNSKELRERREELKACFKEVVVD